ncbi:DUF6428 family protein [Flavobacteriaceae bacterium F89]|uniref:DUF6428 family protein n=1 Tax=Cerina litoralis TaxID=2874477 RepID=A0AAE3EWK7_9FLAO|nr:DUF6428 family protein [Cerina litoralis]MCG2461036.1 DUF6428 family protein [Cerina litoralis]
MKLSEFKSALASVQTLNIQLPNGNPVPSHFHVTEIGKVSKQFMDCGGKIRNEQSINFQLWEARDFDHRINPEKLAHIIASSENNLNLDDREIEVEYQSDTIGKYGLDFDGAKFLLTTKRTDCLAKKTCGAPKGYIDNAPVETAVCCNSGAGCR